MFDIHVHTTHSHDGKSTVSDYARLLRSDPSIEAIGLAEHVDFMPECGGYGTFLTREYLDDAHAAAKDGLEGRLFAGAEIDYSDTVRDGILMALRCTPYAYTIASVHVVDKTPFSTSEKMELFQKPGVFEHLVKEYYRQVTSSLYVKEFDCVGHVGIFKRYMPKPLLEKMGLTALIRSEDLKLAEACAKSGKILEVNTSGYGSPHASHLPDADFLKAFYDAGGRRIAMGSDAHTVANVCGHFNDAWASLAKIGFKTLLKPWDRV